MGTVAWGAAFGSAWGNSWTTSTSAVAGGSYKTKKRVLIGKETLYVTDDELSVILRQLMDEPVKQKKPDTPKAKPDPRIPPEIQAFPRFEQIARQQIRLNDFDTFNLMRELARLRDEEDIEMLVLH